MKYNKNAGKDKSVSSYVCCECKAFKACTHAGGFNVVREERREAWRQEGICVYDAYCATGLHLRGDEADILLAQLERGNDVETHDCHL